MLFSEKWLRNRPKFLLDFLIHIDVFMLCRKFELIPSSNFSSYEHLKNGQFLKNALYYSPWFFPKNCSKNAKKKKKKKKKKLSHFLIHIDVLMLCRKFELIPASIFRVMAILRNEPFFENFPVL